MNEQNQINKILKDINKIIETLINDELSLIDIEYLKEQLKCNCDELQNLTEEIINQRFMKSLNELEKEI